MPTILPVTIWNRYFGTRQGRIQPHGVNAPFGEDVYCLGDDLPGNVGTIAAGDYHEVAAGDNGQVDVTSTSFIRALNYFVPRTPLTGDARWKYSILVDGIEQISYFLERERARQELVANVSKLSGLHRVAFRFGLVGTAGNYQVELPGVYLDEVLVDSTATTPQLVNRDPEPFDTQAPINGVIQLDIVDVTAGGLNQAATQVYVNGVLAFSNGVFQTGFTGAGSSFTQPRTDTFRITVDPLVNFTSQQLVTVRVVSAVGASTLDESYSFNAADIVRPVVETEAQARSRRTVRVTFSEAVKQLSASSSDDALNPSNYSIVRDTAMDYRVPSASVNVVSVASVTPTSVDLTTDIEMTPDAMYLVNIVNVADLVGNALDPAGHTAACTGWHLPFPTGRRFKLYDMMPKALRAVDISYDYTMLKFLGLLQEPLDLMLYDIDLFSSVKDPDRAAEQFVDAMLAELGNPFPFDLDLVTKRKLVRQLVPLFQIKGSDQSVIDAVRLLVGVEVTITQYNLIGWILGDPDSALGLNTFLTIGSGAGLYSFEVTSAVALTADQIKRINYIVRYLKPATTHYVRLNQP